MRRQTLKNQLIDTGVRYVVRNVRDIEVGHNRIATGFVSYQSRRRSVSKRSDDLGSLEPWTLDAANVEVGFTWDDYEAGDVPEDDETVYRLIDGEETT